MIRSSKVPSFGGVGSQSRSAGAERDGAGGECRADGDAVDAALGRQVGLLDRADDAAVEATTPDVRAPHGEGNTRIACKIARPICINDSMTIGKAVVLIRQGRDLEREGDTWPVVEGGQQVSVVIFDDVTADG
jgi:hypothetical protein